MEQKSRDRDSWIERRAEMIRRESCCYLCEYLSLAQPGTFKISCNPVNFDGTYSIMQKYRSAYSGPSSHRYFAQKLKSCSDVKVKSAVALSQGPAQNKAVHTSTCMSYQLYEASVPIMGTYYRAGHFT